MTFDGRVVAATNRDLEAAVAHGEFRRDLYYRLNVFPVAVPPLRRRKEDIPLLARHFAAKHGKTLGRKVNSISRRMLDHMIERDWSGNIRELESFVHRALIIGEGPVLDLPTPLAPEPVAADRASAPEAWHPLREVERSHVLRVLDQTDWVVQGQHGAASRLGLAPSTLRSRMKKLGIQRSR